MLDARLLLEEPPRIADRYRRVCCIDIIVVVSSRSAVLIAHGRASVLPSGWELAGCGSRVARNSTSSFLAELNASSVSDYDPSNREGIRILCSMCMVAAYLLHRLEVSLYVHGCACHVQTDCVYLLLAGSSCRSSIVLPPIKATGSVRRSSEGALSIYDIFDFLGEMSEIE